MKRSVEVELHRSGQPRPYADHEYVATLIFRGDTENGWASKYGWAENQDVAKIKEIVKPYVQLFVHPFVEGAREWHQPWLEKLEYAGAGIWDVVVKSPYLD